IESLWNIVSEINKKGFLYKDYKVVPWCPRCGTGLSSHELAQGYEDVKDLTVYAKFKIVGQENTYLLAWTTTPWTLPGNVALAIGEKIDYVKIRSGENFFILGKTRLSVIPEGYEVLEEFKGKDLIGLEYEPLYPFLKDNLPDQEKEKIEKTFKVYSGSFVTTEDGTGIVHIAPMYGTDDFDLGTKEVLPKFHIVNEDGTFKDFAGFLAGKFVKDEDVAVDVIKDLAGRNLLFKKEKHEHSYPHCWRCKTPLIYYARDSWYIKMSSLRDKLVKENEGINWEPSYIKDGRFGEWLKDIKDWAISRERYWGTPLPVWKDDEGKEIFIPNSIENLKGKTKRSGNKYLLMRHGEATQNVEGVLSSTNKVPRPLTEKGREQVISSAQKLKEEKIDIIIYSPIIRAKQTADEISKVFKKEDIQIIEDERIREEDFGELSDTLKASDFTKYFPDFKFRLDTSVAGCETLRQTKKRIGEFLYDIEKKYSDKNILIISHDGPLKLMKAIALGVDDKELEEIYIPTEDFLVPGNFIEFDFVSIPHDEDYKLDLHKPYIDEIEVVGEKGKILKRTKEVMDVWFDSGSMPFASNHYPMENKELVEDELFPADFICEAIDQTRGWFYTLHAIGVLLGKGKAFKNVICLGLLMDKDGKKMSKSIGNVVDPEMMMDKYGADALRLWMYSINQPGESKNFDEKSVDEIVKKNFNLLSNVLTFYELYRDKELESNEYPVSENILDKWILTRLSELVNEGTKNMNNYKVLEPVRGLREFIDDLSTWYVRRSRERLRDGDKDAKKSLYFVLKTISKYMAPFAPFYAESLYQNLRLESDVESVHLEKWPEIQEAEKKIIEDMKAVRGICSLGLKERSNAKINVRQPLKKLKIKGIELAGNYQEIIKDEINVKEIVFDDTIQNDVELDTEITPELKEEGVMREFVRAVQDFRKEKGFEAKDRAALSILSDEPFKKIVSRFEDEIKKIAGLNNVKFVLEADKEIKLESFVVKISIEKQ
ncbi:MAG: class I tRNA ligase family protein, partial [bacterium]